MPESKNGGRGPGGGGGGADMPGEKKCKSRAAMAPHASLLSSSVSPYFCRPRKKPKYGKAALELLLKTWDADNDGHLSLVESTLLSPKMP